MIEREPFCHRLNSMRSAITRPINFRPFAWAWTWRGNSSPQPSPMPTKPRRLRHPESTMHAWLPEGPMFALYNLGGGEIALVVALIFILFMAKKLPEMGKGFRWGIR